jgi:DNA-binding transcriptional ArsR family regulator
MYEERISRLCDISWEETPMSQVAPGAVRLDTTTAELFAVLSSPIRLAVLRLLLSGERCVTELVEAVGVAQPRLSNHLACLRTCGFVTVRRQGTFMYYGLADPRLAEVIGLGVDMAQPSAESLLHCPVLREERDA